jgi:uncharacterized protein
MLRIVAVAEVILAAAVVVGHNVYRVIPNEVLVLLVVGAISLAIRRQSLRSIGFRRPTSWTRTFLIALAAAAALQLLSTYVTEPLISRFTNQPSDLSQFRELVGNAEVALVWLAIVWTFAAFGEEFVYRGYVLNRMAESAGGGSVAWPFAVIATAVLFGIGHYYQGPTGMIDTAISALVFGGLYVWSGRNLWPPILAHGLSDTIAVAAIYCGLSAV